MNTSKNEDFESVADYYRFQSEADEINEDKSFKLEKHSEENGFQITYNDENWNWIKKQVFVKEIRSIPVIIELFTADSKTEEGAKAMENGFLLNTLFLGCSDVSYSYSTPDERKLASVCVSVNYDKKTLEQEVERIFKNMKSLEEKPVNIPLI